MDITANVGVQQKNYKTHLIINKNNNSFTAFLHLMTDVDKPKYIINK